MKKLTKIMNALRGKGRRVYINVHYCNEEDRAAILKRLPKDLDIVNGGADDKTVQWSEVTVADCEGFAKVKITIFTREDAL